MVWVKCRTCLENSNSKTSSSITEEFLLGKSFKEVILLFVPQMVTAIGVDDVICFNCSELLKTFARFIRKCIAVEEALKKANEQKKNILRRSEESSRQLTNDSLTQSESSKVNLSPLCDKNKNRIQLKLRQDLHKYLGQPNFKSTKPVSTYSNMLNTDCQTVINEEIIELSDTEEPEPPLQRLFTNNRLEQTYSHQKSTMNCQNNLTVEPFNLPHKQAIRVQPTQSTADKINDSYDISRTDCHNKLTAKTRHKEYLLKEADDTVPCAKDNFGNNSTGGSGDGNSLSALFEDVEDTAEEANDAVEQIEVKVENERFNIIEEGSLHLYPIKNHNRVISVRHTNEILAGAIKSNIDVYQYGPPKGELENRRILFFGSVIVQCPECNIILKSGQNLEDHIESVHLDVELPNGENNKLCNYTLAKSEKRNSSCLFYQCEKCGKKFKAKCSLASHCRKYQKFKSCDVRKCFFCSEMVARKDYPSHSKTHRKAFICDKCGEGFVAAHHLEFHSVKHHIKKEELELCPICGKMAKHLTTHLKTHDTGPKRYMCHKCPKLFMTQSHLTRHIRSTHLGIKNFYCRQCKMMFSTATNLKEHRTAKHSKDFPYICELCGKEFARIDYLRKHINSHTSFNRKSTRRKYRYAADNTPGPATCKYCSKVFKSVYRLRVHLLTHITRLRYKCNMCSLTFSNYANKYKHEKRHKCPYFELSCTVCWSRMATKEELEKHMIKHESSKKYRCQFCELSFARMYLLNHHISENHTNIDDLEKEKEAVLADALEEFLL